MILIDTCALLWLAIDQEKLSENAKELIKANANKICISAISAFEIGVKTRKKLLKLPLRPEKWFEKATQLHGIEVVPITAEIAMLSTQLPTHHYDPTDRIIIATAMVHNYTILTPDQHIYHYPKIRVVW